MTENRINMVGYRLKEHFGHKTVKLSIDGGFTCPNRDGSKGTGGCVFCSETGSGDTASNIDDQIKLLSDKWPDAKYLAYFQNHTNTYADVNTLKEKYYEALNHPAISGLVIGTRPDCLPDDVLDLLETINKEHFLWVEIGLQTIHKETSDAMNLCYNIDDWNKALTELRKRNIRVVTHLILGLPGETTDMMRQSVEYVSHHDIWGLKLHLLNVVKNTELDRLYPGYQSFEELDDYVQFVCDLLEIIPYDIVMHRLTADVPRKLLVSPPWSFRKRTILNGINKEMKKRGSYQGIHA